MYLSELQIKMKLIKDETQAVWYSVGISVAIMIALWGFIGKGFIGFIISLIAAGAASSGIYKAIRPKDEEEQ